MSDHVVYLDTMRLIMGTSSAITNHKNLMTLKRIKIYILEMEDVLFHLNSAVMMPENSEGKSSGDSGGGSSSQEKVSGLSALGLVFKQFEFDPKKRMIIAGHTDTSGQPKDNFDLSKERAENILYLLTGDKIKWAEICANRHKVEDYQQIMKFFAEKNGIDCDPVKIDNKWGDKTENATKGFLKKTIPDNADTLLNEIKTDSKKKWPEEVWQVVYDLYIKHLCKILGVPNEDQLKKRRDTLKYVNDTMPYVSCGESFPIDSKEKKNYRSQKNRRVEILFFDKDEIQAETIKCPPARTTVHKEEECPLWKKIYFLPLYIDPKDLNSLVFHLKFVYYDRIKGSIENVPAGIKTIKAIENGNQEIPTVTAHKNGIYYVKVQFPTPLDDPNRKKLHFEFESNDLWIYTANKAATPVIKTVTEADFKNNVTTSEERWKYYDIPSKWSSEKYWTRYEGTNKDILNGSDKGKMYKDTFYKELSLKPFGDNLSSESKPLIFSYDDMVLTRRNLSPIPDKSGDAALFDKDLKIIEPNSKGNKSYYTKGVIKNRYIPYRGKDIRFILFDNRLYAVYRDRVTTGDFIGHRAAVFRREKSCSIITRFRQLHHRGTIGNFDSYLLRNVGFENGEEISLIFNYFRWHFCDAEQNPTTPIDQTWIDKAISNLCNVWNDSSAGQLVSLMHGSGSDKKRIYINFYMEHVEKPSQHTIIKVWPANKRGRSFMGKYEAEFRYNQCDINSTNKSCIGAHEFGHAGSLDDDYLEQWNNCCYRTPGFVDFKPGSPFFHDEKSMMIRAIKTRSRQYWHFAEWLREKLIPGKNLSFTVDQKSESTYKYTLPENSLSQWNPADNTKKAEHYYNFPFGKKLHQKNKKSNKGLFDCYLYPLGADPFSQGKMFKGKKFSAILVVKVNMYLDFWFFASYDDIVKIVAKIDKNIRMNLTRNNGIKVNGTAPFTETFVQIQPRFLVKDYSRHYKKISPGLDSKSKYEARRDSILNNAETKLHFTVEISNPLFGRTFSKTEWKDSNTLDIITPDLDDFWGYFCQMLGLNFKQIYKKDNFDVTYMVLSGIMANT